MKKNRRQPSKNRISNLNYYNMWQAIKKTAKSPRITDAEIRAQVEPVLREIEKNGILIDLSKIELLSKDVGKQIKKLEKEILSDLRTKINLDSPSQLSDILFKKLKLPTADLKKTQSGFSTAAGELYKIKNSHPAIPKILKYREFSKLKSTYLLPLPKLIAPDGRLHTHYTQDARTGRITSKDPNLQNIPIKGSYGEAIRKTFIAPRDKILIAADYSQIELRIIAAVAGDRHMTEAFVNNRDVHAETAALVFHKEVNQVTASERRFAKTINFGVLYGMTPFGLSQALNISQEEANRYIFEYFHAHQGIKEYIEETIFQARKRGFVETLFGFKRVLENITADNRVAREADERMAVNTPIQGTAAEILKLAMINLSKELKKFRESKLILTIHDELVVECRKSDFLEVTKLITQIMEEVVNLPIPIKVEVKSGNNLAEAK